MSRRPAVGGQGRQVTLADAGQVRFVVDVRVDLARGRPEILERTVSTTVVPDTRGDHAVAPRDASHLP